jgi:hypothetical protein
MLALALIVWLYFFESLWIPTIKSINYQNMNKLIERLAGGYISSYIFFVVVVLIKAREDKKAIRPIIADHTYMMLNNIMLFANELRTWGKIEKIDYEMTVINRNINIYPTKDEVLQACGKIKPDMDTRELTGIQDLNVNPTFFEIMKTYAYHVDQNLNTVLTLSNHLDLSFLKLLTSLKVSRYHNEMITKLMFKNKLGEETFHSFSRGLDEYFQIILKIEKYAEKSLKSYVERPALKGENR